MKNRDIGSEEQQIRGLNKNHIRKISIILGEMEKDLSLIELYMNSAHNGRMYKAVNQLPDNEKQRILSAIEEIKACIAEFADYFNLPPLEDNIRGIIHGNFSIYWANVCNLAPDKIKAYGEVGKDAIEPLNRFTGRLIELLNSF